MKCPAAEDLLRLELGELTVNRVSDVERHVSACPSCAQRQRDQRELLGDLGTFPQLELADSAFIVGVLRRRDALPQPPIARRPLRWAMGLATAAALAASWLAFPHFRQLEGTFTARGAKSQARDATFVEVLRVHAHGLDPIRDTTLHPGDAIGVRFTNTAAAPRFLMAFALDSQREIHWIYPAYLDPASNPSAVRLEPNRTDQLLDEVVEPESPAPGALRVVTLVLSDPMTVKDVESRILGGSLDPKQIFPTAQVKEWGCTWVEK